MCWSEPQSCPGVNKGGPPQRSPTRDALHSIWRPRVSLRLLFLLMTILCIAAYLGSMHLYVATRVGYSWSRFVSGDATTTMQDAADWLISQGFRQTDDSPQLATTIHDEDGPIQYVFFEKHLASGRVIFAGVHTSEAAGGIYASVLFANDWRELRWKANELARDHQLVTKLSDDFKSWFKSYKDERLRSLLNRSLESRPILDKGRTFLPCGLNADCHSDEARKLVNDKSNLILHALHR